MLLIAAPGLAQTPLSDPYALYGYVLHANGTSVPGAAVKFSESNTSCTLNRTAVSDGSYVLDLANCTQGYFPGDAFVVNATHSAEGSYGEATAVLPPGNYFQVPNITARPEPQWRSASSNVTAIVQGGSVFLSAQGIDGRNLTNATLATNETGTWVNWTGQYGSPVNFTSPNSSVWLWANFTWQNGSVAQGADVGWRVKFVDEDGNANMTDIGAVRILDTTPPAPLTIGSNNSIPFVGDSVLFFSQWSDNVALDRFIFSWNATGAGCNTWGNDSAAPVSSGWANVTKTIPQECEGKTVGFRFYANDTSNNWNNTSNQSVVVRKYAINITANVTSQSVAKNQNAAYNVTVRNDGSVSDTINFFVDNPKAQFLTFNTSPLPLAPGEQANRTLTVRDSFQGSYPVAVLAVSAGDASKRASASVTTLVKGYGVFLSPDTFAQAVNTSQNATYNITITNVGNDNDTINLSVSTNTGNASLNTYSVNLSAGASVNVVLTVNNSTSCTCIANLTANSTQEPSQKAQINLTTTVESAAIYGVALSIDPPTRKVELNDSAVFNITIKNTGNRADSFTLGLSANTQTAQIDLQPVSLAAGASTVRTLTVKDARPGVYTPQVTATSAAMPARSDSVAAATTVASVVEVMASPSSQTVNISTNATYAVTVANRGTKTHVFDLKVGNLDGAGLANVSPASLTVASGDSASATLTVNNSSEGAFMVIVNATAQDDSLKNGSVSTATLVVPRPVYGVSLVTEKTRQVATNATNASYTFTLTNSGSVSDTFNLTVVNSSGASTATLSANQVTLKPGASHTLVLTVGNPAAGTFRVAANATSSNDTNVTVEVVTTTTVNVIDATGSTVINSVVSPRCGTSQSTIIDSRLGDDCGVYNSTVNNSIIGNGSFVRNSTINDSTVGSFSSISFSAIRNSSVGENSNISGSTVINATLSNGISLVNAYVQGESPPVIYNGTAVVDGVSYTITTPVRLANLSKGAKSVAAAGVMGKNQTIDPADVFLDVRPKGDFVGGSLAVARAGASSSGASPTNGAGIFINVAASANIERNLNWAILRVYYSTNEIPSSLDGNSLKLRVFNPATNQWEELQGGIATDAIGRYVWGNTSHFSVFAIAGQPVQAGPTCPPTCPPPGGGGPGGGGGAAAAAEKVLALLDPLVGLLTLTINAFQQHVLPLVSKGVLQVLDFTQTFVTQVTFTLRDTLSNIVLTVQQLARLPPEVKDVPSGQPYQYFAIRTENIGQESNILQASISFKVERSALEGLSADGVRLQKYLKEDGKLVWKPLPTVKLKEDDRFVYYNSTAPGFSIFAIAGERADARVSLFAVTLSPPLPPAEVPGPTPTPEPRVAPILPTIPGVPPPVSDVIILSMFGMVVLIAALSTFSHFATKGKRKRRR